MSTHLIWPTNSFSFQRNISLLFLYLTIIYISISNIHDPHTLCNIRIDGSKGGTRDTRPSRSNFFHFHAVLAKISPNNRSSAQTQGLASPPPGNPGSATDMAIIAQNLGFNCVGKEAEIEQLLVYTMGKKYTVEYTYTPQTCLRFHFSWNAWRKRRNLMLLSVGNFEAKLRSVNLRRVNWWPMINCLKFNFDSW